MAEVTTEVSQEPHAALQLLADEYSIQILNATLEEEKSAKELSWELDIPIATVYRRIEELVESGFLEYEGKSLTEEGKRAKVYRSYLDQIKVLFGPEQPRIEMETHTTPRRMIDEAWSGME